MNSLMSRTITSCALAGGIVLAVLFTVPSFAAVPKPAEIDKVVRAPQPYGAGSLGFLFMRAYDASLWTDAAQWSMQSPFALSLTYHMGFSADDIASRSLEEIKHDNPALPEATLTRYRTELASLFAPVKSGDEMTGLYTPDGTVRFFRNGQETGQVRDPAFAQAFFGIWLSPQTSEPALRNKLLRLSA